MWAQAAGGVGRGSGRGGGRSVLSRASVTGGKGRDGVARDLFLVVTDYLLGSSLVEELVLPAAVSVQYHIVESAYVRIVFRLTACLHRLLVRLGTSGRCNVPRFNVHDVGRQT